MWALAFFSVTFSTADSLHSHKLQLDRANRSVSSFNYYFAGQGLGKTTYGRVEISADRKARNRSFLDAKKAKVIAKRILTLNEY